MAATPRHRRQPNRDLAERGTRALVVGLVLNVVIAAAKVAGGVVTGSAALLAAGGRTAADVGHQGLLAAGRRRESKGRDYWSFVIAIALHAAASAFAVLWGIGRLDDPEPLVDPTIALGVLAGALVLHGLALRSTTGQADDARGDVGYRSFVRRARRPVLPVLLVEHVGALVATAVALAGVGATTLADDARWDAWGAIGVGVVAGLVALVLVAELKTLLIGGAAPRHDVEAVRAAIEIEPDVLRVVDLRTQHLGPDDVLVGVKVELQHELSVVEVADTIGRIERSIRTGVPAARTIYVSPDVSEEHRGRAFVAEHTGSIDPTDPRYVDITGHAPDDDDPLWTD